MFAEIPPRVEYQVTPLGLSLVPAVLALAEWAATHTAEIAANRDAYDAAKSERRPRGDVLGRLADDRNAEGRRFPRWEPAPFCMSQLISPGAT